MANYQQFERDESQRLQRLVEEMNRAHAEMGGRDNRPERVALLSCMKILRKEIDRSHAQWLQESSPQPQQAVKRSGPAVG